MKKLHLISLLSGVSLAISLCAVFASRNNFSLIKATNGSPRGNHYAKKLATTTESGYMEYWIDCSSSEVYLEEPSEGVWVDQTTAQSGGAPIEGHAAYVAPTSITMKTSMAYDGYAPEASDIYTTNHDGVATITWYDSSEAQLGSAPVNAGNYYVKVDFAEGAKHAAVVGTKQAFEITPFSTNIVQNQPGVTFTATSDSNLVLKNENDGSLTINGWWVNLYPTGMTAPAYTTKINFLVKNPALSTYRLCITFTNGNWTDQIDVPVKDYDSTYKILSISFEEASQIYSRDVMTVSEMKFLVQDTGLNIASIFYNEEAPKAYIDGSLVSVSSSTARLTNHGNSLSIRALNETDAYWWNSIAVGESGYTFEAGADIVKLTITPKKYIVDDIYFNLTFNNTTVQQSVSSMGCTLSVGTTSVLTVPVPSGATKLVSFGFSGGKVFDQILFINSIEFMEQPVTVNVNSTPYEVIGTQNTVVSNDANGYLVLTEWWTYFKLASNFDLTGKTTLKIKVTNTANATSYLYKVTAADGIAIADAAGTQLAVDGDGYLNITLDFGNTDSRILGEIGLCNTNVGNNTVQEILVA